MPDVDDMDLLRDYARSGSETAFAELVRRHIGLVYSVALRHVGIPAHAEEITQAVFIILARKAGRLRPNTVLEGWLHETARLTALSYLRGERRRQFREQESYMQSHLNEPAAGDAVWQQLAPLLDEALSRLGKKDLDAVILRFFKEKSVREVAATIQTSEAAAQRRVLRALEKLRHFFSKHGISSTTAILAGVISANAIQAAPATLAKTVTAVALAKGATASISTLTLIKGALKIMEWTKAKTAIVAGAGLLLVAGTATVTVREIQEHRLYPWQVHPGNITEDQVNQPPQVRILSSKFRESDWATIAGKMIGTGVRAENVVASAYGYVTSARVVYSTPLPPGRYDYIACLPGGIETNAIALQEEAKRKFGVVGRIETREADVRALRVKNPDAPGLKRNDRGPGNGLFTTAGGFHGLHEAMSNLAYALEDKSNVPVLDETGITGRYDFDLKCTQSDLESHNWDAVNRALDPLGLELVPANRPLEMLVVEKTN